MGEVRPLHRSSTGSSALSVRAERIITTSQEECIAWLNSAGLDVRHSQISSGSYVAKFELTTLSKELRFSHSVFGAALAMRGAPPGGVYTFSLSDSAPNGLYFNQQLLGADEVAVVCPGNEFFVNRPAGTRSLGVYADAGLVDRRCKALHGVSAQAYFRHGTKVRADRAAVAECIRQFSQISRRAAADRLAMQDEDDAARLREQLVDSVLGAIGPPERLRGWSGRHRLLDRAWEIVEGDTSVVTVGQLCAKVGAPIRTLDDAFRAGVGISPKRFILAIRLNQVRQQLNHPGKGTTVTRVATGLSFYHFGHFCRQYRNLFGETPSSTLRCARNSGSQ
jgi:AraC family ethanolamine operon transcriptional activator